MIRDVNHLQLRGCFFYEELYECLIKYDDLLLIKCQNDPMPSLAISLCFYAQWHNMIKFWQATNKFLVEMLCSCNRCGLSSIQTEQQMIER